MSTGSTGSQSTARWLWALVALVVGVRYAEPILDGDLFWHMAYARQMLEHGTLRLDHTAFSWTPASNAMIYCAWLSEMALYGLWERLGPWSLFALRYAVVGGGLAAMAGFAWRAGLRSSPLLPASLVVVALMTHAGTLVKPELFSFACLQAVAWVYFRAKLRRAEGAEPAAAFYAVPAIVLVWVNSHGGFVLAVPLLAATAIGELWNARAGAPHAFSPRSLRHLGLAWSLAAVAVTVTPYGPSYPLQLVDDYLLGATPRPDVAWNSAHLAVFDPRALRLHLAEYLVVLGAALVALFVALARRGQKVDRSLALANLAYAALYLPQLRSTYLWPVVGAYTLFLLAPRLAPSNHATGTRAASRPPALAAATGLAVGLALVFSLRTLYEARYRPLDKSWLGFGVSDVHPVAEAEFLAAAGLGPNLYNIFDSGGYLLWRLDPQYKVMTDSRSFPYLAWFEEQRRFTLGEEFESFLASYPADVAVIDLAKDTLAGRFLAAPAWRLAYLGPVAAVFVRGDPDIPEAAYGVAPGRFERLRNPHTAQRLFEFALRAGEREIARQALAEIEARHLRSLDPAFVRWARARRDAGLRPPEP